MRKIDKPSREAKTRTTGRGFLSRLRRDQSGNVLAMVAISTFPVVGAIGGGVDFARGYMAEARLSQACDASVLAGRKLLREADTTDDGAIIRGSPTDREIQRFLDYNFADGQFGTAPITRTAVLNDEGELRLTLATTLPTELLPIVGIDSLNIKADCASRRSGVNVDVVLVLDVTGSMTNAISGSQNGSHERINALRESAGNFLDILDELRGQLEPSGLRVRIGVVPYASAVNVGHDLYDEDPSYIRTSNAEYYSFMRSMCKAAPGNNYCDTGAAGNNGKYFHASDSGLWNGMRMSGETGPVTLDLTDYVQRGRDEPGNAYGWGGCVEARATTQSITGAEASFSAIPDGAWDIKDVAPGVDGAPAFKPYLSLPEYDFRSFSNNYGPPTPAQSTDPMWQMVGPHQPDKVPYRINPDQKTLGNPAGIANVSNFNYARYGSATEGPNHYCPSRVKLLSEHDTPDLKDYLDDLVPAGFTYHDLGMYWGLALISPGAPFTNPDTYINPGFPGTAQPVKRYIVFMTDGDMDTSGTIYSAYGYETRPSGSGNNVTTSRDANPRAQHRVRFRMLCEAAKRQGIEISTVAFSKSVNGPDKSSLQGCATSSDQYYEADSASSLNAAFEKIAKNIGYLRVSG